MLLRSLVVASVALVAVACGGTSSTDDSSSSEAAATGGASTGCRANEDAIFLCETAQAKTIAVCVSKGITPTSGYVVYRYGKANATPDKELYSDQVRSNVSWYDGNPGDDMFNGLYNRGVSFSTPDGYFYTVWSMHGHDGEENGDGVRAVDPRGQTVAHPNCAGMAPILDIDPLKNAGIRSIDL